MTSPSCLRTRSQLSNTQPMIRLPTSLPLKPCPNGLASRRKFAKPELAYGLAKGGQTDSQVGSQKKKSQKAVLCRLVLGGQTVKNLCLLASKFELDQSQRKSSQVDASGWPNETQVQTCVDLRVRLARA